MALVTDAEVKEIYPTTSDTTPYITIADLIVTENLSASGLSAARLKEIERLLAAHFAVISLERGGISTEKVGESSESYFRGSNINMMGLRSTRFGQQAMVLDTSGVLSKMSTTEQRAQFRVV